ncbi:MAG TPA: vWA domain-containing protein [Thermoplasmata archaeon]|nr:vWA domain-containing protein [Thermoplasmata archaeon]
MIDAEPYAGAQPLPQKDRHILILDLSKSMLAPLPDTEAQGIEQQKIEVARTAVYRILENAANTGTSFGLITFTENVRVAVPLSDIHRENLPYIEGLISMLQPSGRSAIWDALALGADLLRGMNGGVRGTLVLVTDGWDNASTRFTVVHPQVPQTNPGPRQNLVEHMLPSGSELTLRVIGIGNGVERDKGVDSASMGVFMSELNRRALELAATVAVSYQEVVTGSQLFSQMVNAFLDVGFEGVRPLEQLHPEELARHAASAARALKEPESHSTLGRIAYPHGAPAGPDGSADPAPPADGAALEVDVVHAPGGAPPPYLRDRYGPLGVVIEAYLMQDYDRALDRLQRARSILPAVTRHYWEARIQYAKGQVVEAARALLLAWGEAEHLPLESRGRIVRRLALLQARIQNDKETETLVHFFEETEAHLAKSDPKYRNQLLLLFDRLMDLRSTYQLTRLEGDSAAQGAAAKHEEAVEAIFSQLQDARLENTSGDPHIEGALDFIEICLAEMR